jgi:hypothetical protein
MSAEERFAEPTKLAETALNRLPLTFRIRAVLNSFLGDDFDHLVKAIEGASAARKARTSALWHQMNPKPKLAVGHSLPERPVYWAIQLRDDTGKAYATRCAWNRTKSPQDACREAFGMTATANMTFFNLGTSLASARKVLRTVPD